MEPFKMKYVNEELLMRVAQEVKRERMKKLEDKQWTAHCRYLQQRDTKDPKENDKIKNSNGKEVITINPETAEVLRKSVRTKLISKLAIIPECTMMPMSDDQGENKILEICSSVETLKPRDINKTEVHINLGKVLNGVSNLNTTINTADDETYLEEAKRKSLVKHEKTKNTSKNAGDQQTSSKLNTVGNTVHFESTETSKSSSDYTNCKKARSKPEPIMINKATKRLQPEPVSNLEAKSFADRVKSFRINIKNTLDKVMSRVDKSPIFDEQKQWEQMKNRVKEFEVRFSRNHIYHLQRLFEETKNGFSPSLDLNQQIRFQMKRVLSLYQKVYQATQSFFRSMNVIWMGRHNQIWLSCLKGQSDGAKTVLVSLLNLISDIDITCGMFRFPDELQAILVASCDDGLVMKSLQMVDYLEYIPKIATVTKIKSPFDNTPITKKNALSKGFRLNGLSPSYKNLKSVYERNPLSSRSSPLKSKRNPSSNISQQCGDYERLTNHPPDNDFNSQDNGDSSIYLEQDNFPYGTSVIPDEAILAGSSLGHEMDTHELRGRNHIYTFVERSRERACQSDSRKTPRAKPTQEKSPSRHVPLAKERFISPSRKLAAMTYRNNATNRKGNSPPVNKSAQSNSASESKPPPPQVAKKTPNTMNAPVKQTVISSSSLGSFQQLPSMETKSQVQANLGSECTVNFKNEKINDASSHSSNEAHNLSLIYEAVMASAKDGKLTESYRLLLPLIAKALFKGHIPQDPGSHSLSARARLHDGASARTVISAAGRAEGGTPAAGAGAALDSSRIPSQKSNSAIDVAHPSFASARLTPGKSHLKETVGSPQKKAKKPRKFFVKQDRVDAILDARSQHVQSIAKNDMYKVNGQKRPWMLVEKVSDLLIEEMLIDISKEMLAVQESVVRGLFAAELT